MTDADKKRKQEELRARIHSILAALTPEQALALRRRFGLDSPRALPDDEEVAALLRELVAIKTKH